MRGTNTYLPWVGGRRSMDHVYLFPREVPRRGQIRNESGEWSATNTKRATRAERPTTKRRVIHKVWPDRTEESAREKDEIRNGNDAKRDRARRSERSTERGYRNDITLHRAEFAVHLAPWDRNGRFSRVLIKGRAACAAIYFARRVIFHEPFLFVDDRGIENCYPDARYAASLARHLDSGEREKRKRKKSGYTLRDGGEGG